MVCRLFSPELLRNKTNKCWHYIQQKIRQIQQHASEYFVCGATLAIKAPFVNFSISNSSLFAEASVRF